MGRDLDTVSVLLQQYLLHKYFALATAYTCTELLTRPDFSDRED